MAPPQFRSKLPIGRSSSANSTLPSNPSSAQPSRSAASLFRTSQATSEESNPMSRSGFQEWRNLPTNHQFATNDTMEYEENTDHSASTVLQVSGFGFNQSTQIVEADATVWERYILAHPDAKPLRYKPIQNYNRLDILFGKDRATGSLSIGPKERRLCSERKVHEGTTADDRNTEQEQHNEVTSPLASASVSRATKKRKLRDYVSEEIKAMKQGMDAVAAALDRGNPRNFTESELYSELRKVEGLKKVPAIEIYSKLAANINVARTFLGLPPEDRAIWLSVEFGSDIFDDPNVPF